MSVDLPAAVDVERTNALPGAVKTRGERPASEPMWKRPLRRLKQLSGRIGARLMNVATAPLDQRVGDVELRLDSIARAVDQVNLDLTVRSAALLDSRVTAINLELLKGEVRAVKDVLTDLGAAIAPATGVEGIPTRFAELRERVLGLDRRLRAVVATGAASTTVSAAPEPVAAPSSAPDLFDYAGFERRFRGDPAVVLELLDERYGALVAGSQPVLDIGCGRAELVELLAGRGVAAYGIDTDANLVADARGRDLDVRHVDALTHLRSLPEHSLGTIITTHVVEHLELGPLLELLALAVTRLRPGGLFIAETPNPATLVVLGNSYILDPTHVRPLHPSLLTFLCESAGFRQIDLQFYAPAEGYQVDLVVADDAPPWVEQVNAALGRLNDVLFGPQEYAVIARTPPASELKNGPEPADSLE